MESKRITGEGHQMQESNYCSYTMEPQDQVWDETNLVDVPVTFDPNFSLQETIDGTIDIIAETNNNALQNLSAIVNQETIESSQQKQLYERPAEDPRVRARGLCNLLETSSVAFQIIETPNEGFDLRMHKVDGTSDMDQANDDILQGWERIITVRQNGKRDNFYRHASSTRQFRSIPAVKRYIQSKLQPEVAEEFGPHQVPEQQDGQPVPGMELDTPSEEQRQLILAEANQAEPNSSEEQVQLAPAQANQAVPNSSEAQLQLAPVEANQALPNASTECMSQDEIDVASIVAIDLARGDRA